MKKYMLTDWMLAPHYAYTPFRETNVETTIKNNSIMSPIPAKVPGSVYYDLLRAGIIENPFFEMNSLKCEWVSAHWWSYTTTVELHPCGKRLELVLEGIDYLAHIFFNGKKIGQSDNMYVPFVYDITELAHDGENSVVVVLENAPDEMGQIGYTSKTFTQKARFNYKWDFCTRMISVGLWRPAYVREYDGIRIEDFYFKPTGTNGDAELYINLHGNCENTSVDISIGDFNREITVKRNNAKTRLHVNNVKLWYPVDVGEHSLYDLTITIKRDGNVIDTYTKQVGFRDFKLTENDAAPLGAYNYVFTCNGKKIYAKGVNLTPLDISCFSDREKCEKLLTLLANAHINLVRVWGGGVIEDENFYSVCDRLGIMVWQEFIQSSSGIDNIPSKNELFLERQHTTALYAVKTLRNHVSLCVWSGGNELMDENYVPSTFADRNIAELLGVVTQYSPHIPMLPTSASGPFENGNPDNVGENHDVHGFWKYLGETEHYTYFNKIDSIFHSEFGVDGMSSVDCLKTFLSEKNLTPSSMAENAVWRHHGEWWDTWERDNAIFGEPKTLEKQVARSQFMQAEGLRYAVEANRRRAFRNSGSIIWQANEHYPNVSSTSLIDFLMCPKPAFYQVSKAFAPLNVSLKYDKLIYKKGERVTVSVYIILDGEERNVSYSVKAYDECLTGSVLGGNSHAVCAGQLSFTAEGEYINISLNASCGKLTFENTVHLLIRGENGICSDRGILDFL